MLSPPPVLSLWTDDLCVRHADNPHSPPVLNSQPRLLSNPANRRILDPEPYALPMLSSPNPKPYILPTLNPGACLLLPREPETLPVLQPLTPVAPIHTAVIVATQHTYSKAPGALLRHPFPC